MSSSVLCKRYRGVFIDLDGTLAYVEEPVDLGEVIEYLENKGYDVSLQALRIARYFVGIVDLPRYGFNDERSFLKQVFHRLGIEIDGETLDYLVNMFGREKYRLYPESLNAVKMMKDLGLKTAIVTSIPRFKFESIINELSSLIDYVMTGPDVDCDKSNPRMY